MKLYKTIMFLILLCIVSILYLIFDRTIRFDVRLVKDIDVNYTDLLSVVLAAVSIVVAVFSLGLGILAFFGWSKLREEAIVQAKRSVEESLQPDGKIYALVREKALVEIFSDISVQLDDKSTK